MSTDLQWLLVRKFNSFQVKAGGAVFSRENGNLLNLSSHKYSGLANSKTVNIFANAEGGVTITTNKKDVSPHQIAGAKNSTTLRRSTGTRRAAKIAAAVTAGKGYRADLRHVAVARTSALLRASHAGNFPRATPAKKTRGNKAAAAPKSDEDVIELD